LYNKLASNIDVSFLYTKLTNHKKAMSNNANNKRTNRQKSTNMPTNHISQFWSRVCFFVSNRALFYLKQNVCTRKSLYKKARHGQVSCTSRL